MTVTTIGTRSTLAVQSLVDMRSQLDDLQRQLGSGKKSIDYAGLGLDRGLTVSLRSQMSALSSYDDTIAQVGVRLQLGQQVLGRLDTIAHDVKSSTLTSQFSIDQTGQTADQKTAANDLEEFLSLLNSQAGDHYLFSGKAGDQPATDTADHILNGDGARAGFKQVMAERLQADLGANGLGRLVIPAPAGATVSVKEDVAGSPFGFKLAAITTTVSGATVTAPAGSPPAMSIKFGAANASSGQTVTLQFALPDGTKDSITLTATDASPPAANEFAIGANAAATAVNLRAAVVGAIGTLAKTDLTAASGMAAAQDFFNVDSAHPPQRVAGPPFATATALVDGTSANTVTWYTGEGGSDPARSTAVARIDPSISVAYGVRANEEGLRTAIQSIAVLASRTFSPSDPNAEASYAALTQRVGAALSGAQGEQKIADIQAELGGAQATLGAAKDRHAQQQNTLTDMLQSVEGVSQEEVGAKILALQTNLQASLQTTAMMYQTSILNYL